MKKTSLIIGLLLVLSLIFIGACKKKSSDDLTGPGEITPANTDWDILIMQTGDGGKLNPYYIMLDWLGDATALNEGDTFSLTLDGNTVPLGAFSYGGFWYISGETELNPGQTYALKFFHNGTQKASANVQMPYAASATFPQNFSPGASANVTWSLSNNNQYQYVGVSAYLYVPQGQSLFDEYFKFIDPSARSYTLPANAVDNLGTGTMYELYVSQVNFARDGRTAITTHQTQYHSYNSKQEKDILDLYKNAKRAIRSLEQR